MPSSGESIWDDLVPLFPLPDVVLFPRAVLPLHIFEPRDRQMTADALTSSKLIAIACLKPGWQKNYHGKPPIYAVVGVGKIVAHERLEDGRYNLLLQGVARAGVRREEHDRAYRRAEIFQIEEVPAYDIDLVEHRERLERVLQSPALVRTALGRQLAELAASPVSTATLFDICSQMLIDDGRLKQQLLEAIDVRDRVTRAVTAIELIYKDRLGSDSGAHRLN